MTIRSQVGDGIARRSREIYRELLRLERPCIVVRDELGVGVTADPQRARGKHILASVPSLPPESLGDRDFRVTHGVRQAYATGAMANGIASADMVVALSRAGYLASLGTAGMALDQVDRALDRIRRETAGKPFAGNLIHSPSEPAMERATVQMFLHHRVRCVEASAFMELTPPIVHYRVAGLVRDRDGAVRAENRLVAKVSRTEVAEHFLRPAPSDIVYALERDGLITAGQADLAAHVPMADDLTAEADSGGHTDRRPLLVLLPELIALRDKMQRELGFARPVRVGAAGGIGTPIAAATAFMLGAAYVVTGSINQSCVEAGQSPRAKELLAAAATSDCVMAPSADMFELGVDVQVLRHGTMFAGRARRLHELYRAHDSIDAIAADDRTELEERIFRRALPDVWHDCVRFFTERDPEQIRRADDNPKRQMALMFRWYLGRSSGWSIQGTPERASDYQIWCGPAMGAFNQWATGTYLASPANRGVVDVAMHIMRGAAYASRVNQLHLTGVRLPADCATYLPAPSPGAGKPV